MIITKVVRVKIVPLNIDFYKKLGYDVEMGDAVNVDVDKLPLNSRKKVEVKCDNCNSIKELRYNDYITVFNKKNKYYCSACKGESIRLGVKEKYGVDNVFQLSNIKNKSKSTNLKKIGFEYPTQCKEVFDKTKKTNLLKYGFEYPIQNKEIKNKQQETNLSKYGTKYSFLNEDVKKKIEIVNIDKYGVDHPFKNDDIKLKIQVSKSLAIFKKYDNYNIISINKKEYSIFCKKCNNNFNIYSQDFRNRIKYNTELCTICNPINSYQNSGYEIQLQEFIKRQYPNFIQNTKKIIPPYELDIYIPELKLAFEFNGVWWHNELNKEKNYHLNKTEECEKNGLQLIQIFEDDWLYKQDIVKSIILNKLNKTPNKIYARKCEIREIENNNLIKDFLSKNHIQGFIGSKIKIGLFYNEELISLITFGNRRVAMGKKFTNQNEHELLRFCNKLNTNVIGSASKLFKYFVDNYQPKEIITYADRFYSQGKLYDKLGFKYSNKTEPNYYYVIDGIRHHRFNFRKDVLIKQGFDKNKTEHEIMLNRKIYRIYDSGNLKYTWTLSNL